MSDKLTPDESPDWERPNSDLSSPEPNFLSPNTALRLYKSKLSHYEHIEITDYGQIYYLGENANKIGGIMTGKENNSGYDDENGSYIPVVHDHIEYRYEVLKVIGKGSFGSVIKVYDHKSSQYLALKMVRNEPRFHRQVQEEIKILEFLKKLDKDNSSNIIHIIDHFMFRSHQCMMFELLSYNLYELIKKNKFQGFSLQIIRKFAYSILQCLDLLFIHRIIHCDMKPENILLKQPGRTGIKIIDFGSSCFENEIVYTYIQSRFYRAPEIILGCPYTVAIDMWSFGCILAELFTGYPIFPGESETDQLALIIEVLGAPPERVLEKSKRTKHFFTSKGFPRYCNTSQAADGSTILLGGRSKRGKLRGPPGSKDFNTALKGCKDLLFADFLRKCLTWDPRTRITPPQALKHQWLRRRILPKTPSQGLDNQTPSQTDDNEVLSKKARDTHAKYENDINREELEINQSPKLEKPTKFFFGKK
ncbi:unnamed protein product [Gordionus sp. m RMFG-2023]|uniref:dual specificity tyrosine-phosphorylation-regulated kinase 2-like n=1 Tax=Gordionus sp. m RMFG-2023 TaxID=3053472 RepID=UPI0030DF8477